MIMEQLSDEQLQAHQKNIARLERRKISIRGKYIDGDISKSKYSAKLEEADIELQTYLAKSQVIYFYGKYYKRVS